MRYLEVALLAIICLSTKMGVYAESIEDIPKLLHEDVQNNQSTSTVTEDDLAESNSELTEILQSLTQKKNPTDKVVKVLQKANDFLAKSKVWLKDYETLANLKKWNEAFKAISKAISVNTLAVLPVSALMGAFQTFVSYESPEARLARERFETMVSKLDFMASHMKELEMTIKLGQTKLIVVPSVDVIEGLEEELQYALKACSNSSMPYFVELFHNNYRMESYRLYRNFMGPFRTTSELNIDFLEMVKEASYCSYTSISRVCLVVMSTIAKGINQEAVVMGTTGYGERVESFKEKWQARLEEMEEKCVEAFENCGQNRQHHAMKYIEAFYYRYVNNTTPSIFGKRLWESLTSMYPKRNWAVFTSLAGDGRCDIRRDQYTIFFKQNQNKRNVIVSDRPIEFLASRGDILRGIEKILTVDISGRCTYGSFNDVRQMSDTIQEFAPDALITTCLQTDMSRVFTDEDHFEGYNFDKDPCYRSKLRVNVAF